MNTTSARRSLNLQKQLQNLSENLNVLASEGKEKLEHVAAADGEMTSADILVNNLTVHTLFALKNAYETFVKSLQDQKNQIEELILAGDEAAAEEAKKLQEVKETFEFFDDDDSNTLSLTEFKDCLQAIGLVMNDEEAERKFLSLATMVEGEKMVSLEQFTPFMLENLKTGATPEAVLGAFKELSGSNSSMSGDKLKSILGEENAAYILDGKDSVEFDSVIQSIFSR